VTVLEIARIAAGGDGVGRLPDGVAVFVPRVAPGDKVSADVVLRRSRYARAHLRDVLAPGGGRVEPRCPHYTHDRCGGCQLQHLSMDAQLEAKAAIVADALRRIARRSVAHVPIVAAPAPWHYRTRVRFAIQGGSVGYHPYDRPDRVFDLTDCAIADQRVMRLWRALSGARRLLPDAAEAVQLRLDRDGGLHVLVEGGSPPWDSAALRVALAPPDVSVWWQPEGGAARVVAGPVTGYPALAFEQVHPAFAPTIRLAAVEALGDVRGRIAWDLYGGVGDAARLLAERAAAVWCVDADRSAIEWARRQGGVAAGTIRFLASTVESALPRLPAPDVVITNPPRAGMALVATRRLDGWGASNPGARIAYLSCDPATLARDLTRLPAFGLVSVTAYDLFPQTAHVETLAVLEAT
jgi:23S rRNA (uracil1939-C5)-methyltransferase